MATLLIIVSRYYTRIKMTHIYIITCTSYIVSVIVYWYSKKCINRQCMLFSLVIELPSNHQHPVWSIDTNVPLFGIKFTIRTFHNMSDIILVLIPFNMTLLFTRQMMKFRIINQFKPIVYRDAAIMPA